MGKRTKSAGDQIIVFPTVYDTTPYSIVCQNTRLWLAGRCALKLFNVQLVPSRAARYIVSASVSRCAHPRVTLQDVQCLVYWSLYSRDGNSSLRLGLESHLSRINKDLGLDLDSWTADSRLDFDSWLVRLVKNLSFGTGVYMNVSLRETGCLKKKFKWYFLFILPPYNAY